MVKKNHKVCEKEIHPLPDGHHLNNGLMKLIILIINEIKAILSSHLLVYIFVFIQVQIEPGKSPSLNHII